MRANLMPKLFGQFGTGFAIGVDVSPLFSTTYVASALAEGVFIILLYSTEVCKKPHGVQTQHQANN